MKQIQTVTENYADAFDRKINRVLQDLGNIEVKITYCTTRDEVYGVRYIAHLEYDSF